MQKANYIKTECFTPKTFPIEMYNNIYGSIVICAYIFTPEIERVVEYKKRTGRLVKMDMAQYIKKQWFKARRKPKCIKWGIEDKDFIPKTLDFFGVKQPANFPVAFVQSDYNAVFAPYVNGEVMPLREDGIKGITLTAGKVYPLDFDEKERA